MRVPLQVALIGGESECDSDGAGVGEEEQHEGGDERHALTVRAETALEQRERLQEARLHVVRREETHDVRLWNDIGKLNVVICASAMNANVGGLCLCVWVW